jgi:tetratricopeptide (TPR) repeat protein
MATKTQPSERALRTWRPRPIFVTSTFRDMHAERDWLRTRVFPALEERLRQRFHYLEAIDLRWGVASSVETDEEARGLAVLTVCLGEIERSRPFLIGLIGDRYGWIPPAAQAAAAADEAGLGGNVEGRSITDLEIQYGVLARPERECRSWFYFREPLPYERMTPEERARYADAYSAEPDAIRNRAALQSLKRSLEDALPNRVRTYTAQWDDAAHAVTGLEEWGAQVEEDLWSDVEAESDALLAAAPLTWQEQDVQALDEFTSDRVRGFVGRQAVRDELVGLAMSAVADGVVWAGCVVGEPGSGKSSLFASVGQALRAHDVLVLAHAAGVSVQSSRVSRMLLRWIGELARAIGETDPIADGATADDIDQVFSQLLHRVAATQRVVLLIDALDQFEQTARGRHLTWLPRTWPPNGRLITTSATSPPRALRDRRGMVERMLGGLTNAEAADIVRTVCQRYHRTLHDKVLIGLLGKRRDDGVLACANPLWLEMATEELNLLDADAFRQLEDRRLERLPGHERIHALLLSVVASMPADVDGLYDWVIDAAGRRFGQAWTQAFVNLIGLSRSGCRESDLRVVMTAVSGEPWSDLRFATLRRGFRAHVVQRGTAGQWNFAHVQLRAVVERRLAQNPEAIAAVHRALGDHLLTLSPDDSLHQTETMWHLMREGRRARAAAYYGQELSPLEVAGATAVLAALAASDELESVLALAHEPQDAPHQARIAELFVFDLCNMLRASAPLEVAERVARVAQDCLAALMVGDPENVQWQRHRALSHGRMGDVRLLLGDLLGAAAAFEASLAILKPLSVAHASDSLLQHEMVNAYRQIATVREGLGDLPGALDACEAALAVATHLNSNATHTEWLHDLGACYVDLGGLRATGRDFPSATNAFEKSLTIFQLIARAEPGNWKWQHDLWMCHNGLGRVLHEQGDVAGALAAFQAGFVVGRRLAESDPGNLLWRQSLLDSHHEMGKLHQTRGDSSSAVDELQDASAIAQELVAVDPTNVAWQSKAWKTLDLLGDVRRERDERAAAIAAYDAAAGLAKERSEADPANALRLWQPTLASCYEKIGDVRRELGDLGGAGLYYDFHLGIFERLAKADPQSANARRTVAHAHFRMGNLCAEAGSTEAIRHWRRSLDALQRMRDDGLAVEPMKGLFDILVGLVGDTRADDDGGPSRRQAEASVTDVAVGQERLGFTPHPAADADRAVRLNLAYQEEFARWKRLSFWQRLRVKKPEPPVGI